MSATQGRPSILQTASPNSEFMRCMVSVLPPLSGWFVDCEPTVLLFQVRQTADVLKVGHIVKFCASGHSHAVDEILHIVVFYAKIATSHIQVIFTEVAVPAIPEDDVPRLRDIPVRSACRRSRLSKSDSPYPYPCHLRLYIFAKWLFTAGIRFL